jgi:hypothetical protein
LQKDKSNKKKAKRHKNQSVLIQDLTPLPSGAEQLEVENEDNGYHAGLCGNTPTP